MPKWYCPLPFKHVFVDSTGIAPCCNTFRIPTAIESWATNPNLLKLQQELLSGNTPTQCKSCVNQEEVQGRSLRTDANRDYNNQIFTNFDVDFIDYRSSNVCNFKCRSCEPKFSHGIDQEAKSNTTLAKFYYKINDTKTVAITNINQQWIMDNIRKIKRLMITGGEPTVMPGIKDIINLAVEQNPNINILITTNGSFTDQFWYDITLRMPNLHWTLSLDAIGAPAEIIRHGTDWATVEHNARWLARHSHSFDINTVVSNLNILQLYPLLKFVNKLQTLSTTNGCVHQFYVTSRPYILAVDNISNDVKVKALDHLNLCLTLSLDQVQRDMITGLIAHLTESSEDTELLEQAHQFNSILDNTRNQDHTSLYL